MGDYRRKIVDPERLVQIVSRLRETKSRRAASSDAAQPTVVQCHGCFDIIHPGHIHHLQLARSLGDLLIVTLSADPHVNKGPTRPLVPEALRAASLAALECVDWVYVNPHATATPIGDVKEIEALRQVFGANCPPISATKSLTGHSLGAAGVQEAIYSLLMMNNGFICESANIENLDPAFADMPIVRERRDNVTLACVLSNSFGFGGTNASIVLKRPDA